MFEWENTAIDFKSSLKLSKDEKKLIKKMTMSRETRLKLHIDASRIWNMDMRNVKRHSYLLSFMWSVSVVKSTLNVSGQKKIYPQWQYYKKPFILKIIVMKSTEQIAIMFSTVTMSNPITFYAIIQIQKILFIGKI